MAYFKRDDVADGVLVESDRVTTDKDLGSTSWYAVRAGDDEVERAAWQHVDLPAYASELEGRVAFAAGGASSAAACRSAQSSRWREWPNGMLAIMALGPVHRRS